MSRSMWDQWMQDRDDAEILGMSHAQIYAIKYQALSLINHTGSEQDHLYGKHYDADEKLGDYMHLSQCREQWEAPDLCEDDERVARDDEGLPGGRRRRGAGRAAAGMGKGRGARATCDGPFGGEGAAELHFGQRGSLS